MPSGLCFFFCHCDYYCRLLSRYCVFLISRLAMHCWKIVGKLHNSPPARPSFQSPYKLVHGLVMDDNDHFKNFQKQLVGSLTSRGMFLPTVWPASSYTSGREVLERFFDKHIAQESASS